MKLLLQTTNPATLSFVKDLLEQEDIKAFVFDENISITEGSIGIFPRRIMVIDEDLERARALLKGVDLEHELKV